MPKRRRGEKKTTYFDYNLLFIIIFLLCFGLVMLYSSSSYTSANKYGDSAHYLKLQARNIAIGLVFMFYFAKKDYHVWRKFGRLAYWGALGFCFVVLAKVPGLTRSSHGQSRWIQVGPIGFQPSELAKIAIIIYLAMLIERIPKQLDKVSSMAKVGIRLVPLVVFVAVNNLSTACTDAPPAGYTVEGHASVRIGSVFSWSPALFFLQGFGYFLFGLAQLLTAQPDQLGGALDLRPQLVYAHLPVVELFEDSLHFLDGLRVS